MDNKEAIDILRLMTEIRVPEETKAIDMAIKALQKQVKIKPNSKKNEKSGFTYTCPCCVRKTEHYDAKTVVNVWMNYCNQCGQAIDWGNI